MAFSKVAVIGAHPDDPEVMAAGTVIQYREKGWDVLFVSMTNGDAGHHEMEPEELARRRKAESEVVAARLRIEYVVMDNHDGRLEPRLDVREELIRVLRRFEPDLVITHPPVDYHPDHRNTSQIVCDTAFLLEVPMVVPDTPALTEATSYAFCAKGAVPDDACSVVVNIGKVWDGKVAALALHESQMFEWLPYINRDEVPVPEDEAGRLQYLSERRLPYARECADRFRNRLRTLYGLDAGNQVEVAEAFYGRLTVARSRKQTAATFSPSLERVSDWLLAARPQAP